MMMRRVLRRSAVQLARPVLQRAELSQQAKQDFEKLVSSDRKPFIDVFRPNRHTGTLTQLEMTAAYDRLAGEQSMFRDIVALSEAAPWTREDGKPGLLQQGQFAKAVHELENRTQDILDMCLHALQATGEEQSQVLADLAVLKNMYAYQINNFCYEPCRQRLSLTENPNDVGSAHCIVPQQLAQPRSVLCTAFCDSPAALRWQNYNEYSPANCRVLDPSRPLTKDNVTTMCRSEGSPDEIGFVTNHYVQEFKTGPLVQAAEDLVSAAKRGDEDTMISAMKMAVAAMADINETNKEMPQWCKPAGYAHLRTWIPGPRSHSGSGKLFPEQGVLFQGSDELKLQSFDMSRGETGAMTTIIPLARTIALFAYDTRKFGRNELTQAQAEFELRREQGQQHFLRDVRRGLLEGDVATWLAKSPLLHLELINLRMEIIRHNLTHYGYSVNYIFDNTSSGTRSLFEATGGTTHAFLPTSALANITSTQQEVEDLKKQAALLSAQGRERLEQVESILHRQLTTTSKSRQYFVDMEQKKESSQGERFTPDVADTK